MIGDVFQEGRFGAYKAKNTAADLAQIFLDLRRRNFDLFAVALTAPQLTAPPALDANKMLRLTGFIPTQPMQINCKRSSQATALRFGCR